VAPGSFRTGSGHVDIFVRVTPNASRDAIEGVETRADGQMRLKLRVRGVPEKGKANKAVIALLAKRLGAPKSAVSVVSGETARDKTVRIEALADPAAALEKLTAAG
jgi:uncharacterized protein (TIGR00251 family)